MKTTKLLMFVFIIALCRWSFAADESCYVETEITGAIGPATLDLVERSQKLVLNKKCEALFLLVNTPGGNLQTTRMIVENILNSPYPTLCLVYPSGAHAGSAGAIILQACHLAGAMKATNIGAASPVTSTGQEMPEDLKKKIFNDTRSWVEGLAKLRSRNVDFARDIIDEAKAVSAEEALKLNAIEHLATSKEEFIEFAKLRDFKIKDGPQLKLSLNHSVPMPIDFRHKVMELLLSPEIAYLIFMGSIALLYVELTHPGTVAPGVIGGIGLIISLVSMHLLDVTWGAVALIVAGVVLLIAEAFVAGFGILGLGGLISFFIGSLFLFDPAESGYSLSLAVILPTTLIVGSLLIFVAYLAFSSRKVKPQTGTAPMLNHVGIVTQVLKDDSKVGYIEIEGELWRVASEKPLSVGDHVVVQKIEGLTLYVK